MSTSPGPILTNIIIHTPAAGNVALELLKKSIDQVSSNQLHVHTMYPNVDLVLVCRYSYHNFSFS